MSNQLKFNQGDELPKIAMPFRKHAIAMLVEMDKEFVCESREGTLTGQPGDYLAADGHGGFYPISAEFHEKNYEAVPDNDRNPLLEGHKPTDITGYRNLSVEEVALINEVKAAAEKLGELTDKVRNSQAADPRWVSIAATDLQTGFMALVRSIARPSTF